MAASSRSRRWLLAGVALVASLVGVELALQGAALVVGGRAFSVAGYRASIRQLARGPEEPARAGATAGGLVVHEGLEVVHPYLGFVCDPTRTRRTSYLGFPGERDDPLAARTPGTLVVAVVGGSFAEGVASFQPRDALLATLRRHGLEARVVCLAMGGYKQPQQLFTLAWLLSLGAPIDVVVNIDGFNEVALPPAENVPKGVNPFFPRAWFQRAQALEDLAALRLIGQGALLSEQRRAWARAFDGRLSRSLTLDLLWRARDDRLARRIERVQRELLGSGAADAPFVATGPPAGFAPEQLYERLADHWLECSRLMDALCRSRGIVYVHLLQPNQYHEAGRRLTEEELRVAFRPDHPYRPGVVAGYPRLIERGAALVAAGVDFHDLTAVYRDEPQAIYADDCCHPNRRGYELVAELAAGAIAARLAPSSAGAPADGAAADDR